MRRSGKSFIVIFGIFCYKFIILGILGCFRGLNKQTLLQARSLGCLFYLYTVFIHPSLIIFIHIQVPLLFLRQFACQYIIIPNINSTFKNTPSPPFNIAINKDLDILYNNWSMFSDYNYLFKIVVIGDSGVGKTNLVSQFVD